MKPRICELCNKEESYLYCASDSAFLCWKCDVRVHDANFLVARHIREILCCDCNNLSGRQVSGSVAPFEKKSCRNCSPENPSDDDEEDCLSSSSLSSACVSTTAESSATTGPKKFPRRTETAASSASVTDNFESEALGCYKKNNFQGEMLGCYKKNNFESEALGSYKKNNFESETLGCYKKRKENMVRCKAEEVFVNWSRRFGVNGNRVVMMAAPAMEKLMAVVPYRVAAATAFWFGLRNCDGEGKLRTAENLRRLEEMTRVPRKVILAAEEKLTRVLRPKKARRELEEGWAEC